MCAGEEKYESAFYIVFGGGAMADKGSEKYGLYRACKPGKCRGGSCRQDPPDSRQRKGIRDNGPLRESHRLWGCSLANFRL